MITTGENIPDDDNEDEKYYKRDISQQREKSLTYCLQEFHNKIIKNNILIKNITDLYRKKGNKNIHLLDLATGKGGDISKWVYNTITNVVGIDIIKNNIYDTTDGACTRLNNFVATNKDRRDMLMKPTINFLVGDVGKNILNGNSFSHSPSNNLWLKLWKSSNTSYSTTQFDIISIMFAIHYLFESKTTFDNLIDNIDQNLKNNGYFIGTCLDGQKVFDMFSHKKQNDYITGEKDGKIIWKIKKKYNNPLFTPDDRSLGISIGVFISSINQEITEYLVNFEYLVEKLKEKNIVLVTTDEAKEFNLPDNNSSSTFDTVYNDLLKQVHSKENSHTKKYKLYKNIVEQLSDGEKKISFLSRYFIFKKQSLDQIESNNIYKFIKLRADEKEYKAILKLKHINYSNLKKLVDKEYGSIISTSLWDLTVNQVIQGILSKDIGFTKPKLVVKKSASQFTAVDTGYVTDPPKKLKFKKKSKVTELQLTKLKEDFNRFYPRIKDKITEYQDIAGDNPKYIEFKKILEAFVSKFKLLKVEPNFLKRYSEIEDKLTSLL